MIETGPRGSEVDREGVAVMGQPPDWTAIRTLIVLPQSLPAHPDFVPNSGDMRSSFSSHHTRSNLTCTQAQPHTMSKAHRTAIPMRSGHSVVFDSSSGS